MDLRTDPNSMTPAENISLSCLRLIRRGSTESSNSGPLVGTGCEAVLALQIGNVPSSEEKSTPTVWRIASTRSRACRLVGLRVPRKVWQTRQPSERDRKSTRLNSSHVEISYAVFCLKKKR